MTKAITAIVVIGKGLGYGALGLLAIVTAGSFGLVGWAFALLTYEMGGLAWAIVIGTIWGIGVLLWIIYTIYYWVIGG